MDGVGQVGLGDFVEEKVKVDEDVLGNFTQDLSVLLHREMR